MSATIGPSWVANVQSQPWYPSLVSAAQSTGEPLDVLLATIATEDNSLNVEQYNFDVNGYSAGLFQLHTPGVADAYGGASALVTGNVTKDANEQIYAATNTIHGIITPGASPASDLQAMTVDWPGGGSQVDLPTRLANLSTIDAQLGTTASTTLAGSTLGGTPVVATPNSNATPSISDFLQNPAGAIAQSVSQPLQQFWDANFSDKTGQYPIIYFVVAIAVILLGVTLIRAAGGGSSVMVSPTIQSGSSSKEISSAAEEAAVA